MEKKYRMYRWDDGKLRKKKPSCPEPANQYPIEMSSKKNAIHEIKNMKKVV